MKRLIAIAILLLFGSHGHSKVIELDTFLIKKEQEINAQLKIVRNTNDDQMRMLENETLIHLLESILAYPGTFDHPFSSLQTMSTIKSPDNAFRLFNWNIEDNNGLNSHYCYLIQPSRNDKPNEVIKFKEDHITIPPRPENTLTPNAWYGALYYKIIPVQKGSKTLYTVIGYDGASKSTNKKLIDVFYFKGKSLRLGYPIFQESMNSKKYLRRVFFEYSEKATIAVNLNEKLNAIVFDHLVPETSNLSGMYEFYIPDMTYDGYRWDGGAWIYKEDLIATNQENRKTKIYGPSNEDGKRDTVIDVKNNWIDPVDGNPMGGGTSAIAPLENADPSKPTKASRRKDRQHRKNSRKGKRNKPRSAITN